MTRGDAGAPHGTHGPHGAYTMQCTLALWPPLHATMVSWSLCFLSHFFCPWELGRILPVNPMETAYKPFSPALPTDHDSVLFFLGGGEGGGEGG